MTPAVPPPTIQQIRNIFALNPGAARVAHVTIYDADGSAKQSCVVPLGPCQHATLSEFVADLEPDPGDSGEFEA